MMRERTSWGVVHATRTAIVLLGACTAALLDEPQQVLPLWAPLAVVVAVTAWIDRWRPLRPIWMVDLVTVMAVRAAFDHDHGTEPLFALIGVAVAAGALGRWRGIVATVVVSAVSMLVAVPDAWDHPVRQLTSSVAILALLAGGGRVIGIISERSRDAQRLAAERNDRLEAVLAAVLRSDPRAIIVRDGAGRVVEINRAARDLLHLRDDDQMAASDLAWATDVLVDRSGTPVPHHELPGAVAHRTGKVVPERVVGPAADANRWFGLSAIPVDTPEGRWVVTHVRDVSDETSSLDQLQRQVVVDPLTGVGNRRLLEWTVDDLIDPAEQVGVAVVDLDDFKAVNDVHGHVIGDQVLRQIAERLASVCRPDDVAVRLGGDEFVLVVRRLQDDNAAETIVSRLRSALRAPFTTDAGPLDVSCSVGWITGTAVEVTGLVREADRLMYASKHGAPPGGPHDAPSFDVSTDAELTADS